MIGHYFYAKSFEFQKDLYLDLFRRTLYTKRKGGVGLEYQQHRDGAEYFRIGRCLCNLHFHRAIELIYCLETPKPVIVGGEEMLLDEGELLFVPPLTAHVFPHIPSLRALCVVLPVSYSDISETYTGGKRFGDLILHDKALAKDLYEHLLQLEDCASPLLKQSLYSYVLAKLIDHATLIDNPSPHKADFSVTVLLYIQKHYSEHLTSQSVAKALGYNHCYFSSLFNQNFRSTFSAYVNTVRIQKALPLLQTHTAAEVAEHVGFNNLQSFYYNFKKAVGKTPTEYLRHAKEKSH